MQKNKFSILLFFLSLLIVCLFLVSILRKVLFSHFISVVFASDQQYYQKSLSFYYPNDNFESRSKVKIEFEKENRISCDLDNSLKKAKACTFLIFADQLQGTSFAIDHNLLLTNYHVIKNAEKIKVYLEGQPILARVKKISKQYDMAVLEIDEKVDVCDFSKTETLSLAEDLYAVGWAYGGEGESMITKGVFSRLIMTKENGNFVQSDVLVAPGNSGGPLVSRCGVVGMNTIKFFPTQDLSKLSQTFSLSLSSDFLLEKLDLMLNFQ